ncbi:FAD-binding oxidoreductase [Mesorhizobium sp. M2A.F.Ca.ET.040.01.1.1]|nr:FAD-binding oxidoreductase [Mesorhizobium sp. M2A.F.Ca.ET.040.01.1.1]
MTLQQSIAVIGGGVSGVSCTLMLSREGHRVTVIEEGRIGHGCSWGNGAQYNAGSAFPMAHPGIVWKALRWLTNPNGPVRLAPRELPRTLPWLVKFILTGRLQAWEATYSAIHALNQPCARLYREMLGDADWSRLFRPHGALHVWRDAALRPQDHVVDSLRIKHGVRFDRIDAKPLRDLEPNLSKEYQRGIYFPDSGHVTSPAELVQGLMDRAEGLGASLLSAKVLAIEPTSTGVTVQTSIGPRSFDKVVIAAGIASRDLAKSLGVSLSLASERGYHITMPGVASAISRPVTDAASAFVATPVNEGLRIVGIAEFDSPAAPKNPAQGKKLQACAKEMLPDLQMNAFTDWMGVRPSTPDSLPIIGPHPKQPNVLYATGHGHMGISGAPMTAALISDIVGGRAPRLPCDRFRVR